jgi:hypothetical protein
LSRGRDQWRARHLELADGVGSVRSQTSRRNCLALTFGVPASWGVRLPAGAPFGKGGEPQAFQTFRMSRCERLGRTCLKATLQGSGPGLPWLAVVHDDYRPIDRFGYAVQASAEPLLRAIQTRHAAKNGAHRRRARKRPA